MKRHPWRDVFEAENACSHHDTDSNWLSVETVCVVTRRNFNTMRDRSTESGTESSCSFHAFLWDQVAHVGRKQHAHHLLHLLSGAGNQIPWWVQNEKEKRDSLAQLHLCTVSLSRRFGHKDKDLSWERSLRPKHRLNKSVQRWSCVQESLFSFSFGTLQGIWFPAPMRRRNKWCVRCFLLFCTLSHVCNHSSSGAMHPGKCRRYKNGCVSRTDSENSTFSVKHLW